MTAPIGITESCVVVPPYCAVALGSMFPYPFGHGPKMLMITAHFSACFCVAGGGKRRGLLLGVLEEGLWVLVESSFLDSGTGTGLSLCQLTA